MNLRESEREHLTSLSQALKFSQVKIMKGTSFCKFVLKVPANSMSCKFCSLTLHVNQLRKEHNLTV